MRHNVQVYSVLKRCFATYKCTQRYVAMCKYTKRFVPMYTFVNNGVAMYKCTFRIFVMNNEYTGSWRIYQGNLTSTYQNTLLSHPSHLGRVVFITSAKWIFEMTLPTFGTCIIQFWSYIKRLLHHHVTSSEQDGFSLIFSEWNRMKWPEVLPVGVFFPCRAGTSLRKKKSTVIDLIKLILPYPSWSGQLCVGQYRCCRFLNKNS